jgi:hydroxymethylpyrimidine/phosphomethylpyrimidine kinase
MVATSGDRLIAETPRRAGARAVPAGHGDDAQSGRSSLLLGRTIDGIDALDAAASDCWRWGAGRAAQGRASARRLGGGRAGRAGRLRRTLESQRIATHNGHGTGCTLSSAIASHLALGLPLADAVAQARSYILGAIRAGRPCVPAMAMGR